MRLLLQVMFAQGYLWRDRSPEVPDRSPDQPRTNWVDMGVGLALIAIGSFSLSGSPVAATAMIVSGICVFLAYASRPMSLALSIGKPVSTSLSWACGSLFTILAPVVVVAAVVESTWDLLLLGILNAAFLGTHFLQSIEERYLFFADPENNEWRLAPRESDPLLERYRTAFITLPREVLRQMLTSRPPR